MFDTLSARLSQALRGLAGKATLTDNNIREAVRDVRRALLEADVALTVVNDLIGRVTARALGSEVTKGLNAGQVFIKLVQAELQEVMGAACEDLALRAAPPAVILMAGLQGVGKTTTTVKLANRLRRAAGKGQEKTVMVASVDVQRPAAMAQLQTLAAQADIPCHAGDPTLPPEKIAKAALAEARRALADVLIIDTAGRLAVDQEMMAQISALHRLLAPAETLFVVDAMTGQDAAVTARAFKDALPLSGVILTKADGDARGGAALSVRQVTGVPIKFLGTGEKIEALEPFHPDRIAARILGMGDMLSLMEDAEAAIDQDAARRLAGKMKRGAGFDLEDFREQLRQMKAMGGVAGILKKIPGMGAMGAMGGAGAGSLPDDGELRRMEAIINAMTPRERAHPELLNGSRKRRIVNGSGTSVQALNRVLKQHREMGKAMRKMPAGGMAKALRNLGGGAIPGDLAGLGGLGGLGGGGLGGLAKSGRPKARRQRSSRRR